MQPTTSYSSGVATRISYTTPLCLFFCVGVRLCVFVWLYYYRAKCWWRATFSCFYIVIHSPLQLPLPLVAPPVLPPPLCSLWHYPTIMEPLPSSAALHWRCFSLPPMHFILPQYPLVLVRRSHSRARAMTMTFSAVSVVNAAAARMVMRWSVALRGFAAAWPAQRSSSYQRRVFSLLVHLFIFLCFLFVFVFVFIAFALLCFYFCMLLLLFYVKLYYFLLGNRMRKV